MDFDGGLRFARAGPGDGLLAAPFGGRVFRDRFDQREELIERLRVPVDAFGTGEALAGEVPLPAQDLPRSEVTDDQRSCGRLLAVAVDGGGEELLERGGVDLAGPVDGGPGGGGVLFELLEQGGQVGQGVGLDGLGQLASAPRKTAKKAKLVESAKAPKADGKRGRG